MRASSTVPAPIARAGVVVRRAVAFGLTPVLFAVAGLAFLLPGATVSACGLSNDSTFTGIQLVTHTAPSPGPYVYECTNDPSGWLNLWGPLLAAIVLTAAVLGFLLSAIHARAGPGWCAAMGLLALLFAGASFLGPFGPAADPHSGYWVVLLAFVTAGVSQLIRSRRSVREYLRSVRGFR